MYDDDREEGDYDDGDANIKDDRDKWKIEAKKKLSNQDSRDAFAKATRQLEVLRCWVRRLQFQFWNQVACCKYILETHEGTIFLISIITLNWSFELMSNQMFIV